VCSSLEGAWDIARGTWTNSADHGGVVGLARDGHAIYGPYNAEGELWACDEHDVCNGVFFETG